ncbi:LPS export ABC transporter permease LptF [Paracraurococcus ruber]|uniref:LPS export ABC transporter permease LptF n=1 Tax=Paracraurococcus ruber TaxID=77675 RepID=A0ABS1CZ99_9PROT|nr:LPS export ABC transporter permease LptF [Paracraurococcus ruber]MBK1659770.1 LPS export ABC transporter permease LptF [Paracraurococcus ruber]TDG33361.1 LPS export ABC transporter permease LptF [Paracraurococcus ruber]
MTRLDRYIFRQLVVALLAVTIGLAALVWLTQSLRFIELVLDRGLSFLVFIELTGLLLPSFFAVILPITTFVVTLFVYVRLAADRELVVMRAAGLSQWRLARPALGLATIAAGLCYALNLWLVPVTQASFRAWQFEIRNQLAAILVQEGVFSSIGDDLTVYARYRDRDGTLRGILIHDARERGAPVTILAEAGRITPGPNGPRVTLENGQRQQIDRVPPPADAAPGTPPSTRLNVLSFSENSVDLARTRGGTQDGERYRNAQERTLDELLNPDPADRIPDRDLRRFRAEAHQRLASPLNAIGFGLVALATALAGQFRRHGGGIRLFTGIAVVVALLALGLMVGNLAARQNSMIPLIWVNALAPGVLACWVIAGLPGLPHGLGRRRPRPAQAEGAGPA